MRRAFEQTHPLAVDLFGVDGASRTNSAEDENRVTYPGYTRRADLATLLDGASDKRLTVITLAIVMAAYEAALDRHSWRHDGGCAEKHYLTYVDSLGYQLCNVERLAAGLEPSTRRTDPAPGRRPRTTTASRRASERSRGRVLGRRALAHE